MGEYDRKNASSNLISKFLQTEKVTRKRYKMNQGEKVGETLDEFDFSSGLDNMVKRRKNQINQIINALNDRDTPFLRMMTIQSSDINEVVEKQFMEEMQTKMRALYILGCFLGSILNLPNTMEKVILVSRIVEDFDQFMGNIGKYTQKIYVAQLPSISLNPPTINLKIAISTMKLRPNDPCNNILVNGNSIMRTKNIIYSEFVNAYKIISLPTKMSYATIIDGLCQVTDLIYSIFLDKVFEPKELFELALRMDDVMQVRVFNDILGTMFQASETVFNKESKKVTAAMESNLSTVSNNLLLKKVDDLVTLIESEGLQIVQSWSNAYYYFQWLVNVQMSSYFVNAPH
eukprot:TRINITY_DN7040_c0_g1_i4.p1 TRINITY_DN7040_c0_g1~~TRINITY_DN7040_c0_g1_i4.p1  ORF type:complete len:345 (-),score=32.13 TRINITY_DN7040_c0_g1_i4:168-1202(-)